MPDILSVKDAKEQLRKLILNKALKWNEGLLKDAEIPKWIFDLREVILTPEGSRLTSMLLYDKIKDLDFDMIGGPSIAAEPLIASLVLYSYNFKENASGFIVRKKPNNFGLRKKIEGPIINNSRIILIDDAINSGSGLLDSVEAIKKENCKIVKILTLIDFQKSGHEKLRREGYDVDYIFTLGDFGLEAHRTYIYKKIRNLTEVKTTEEKEKALKKLNAVLNEEILDFKVHENLILVAYKKGSVHCFDQNDYSVKWSLELGETISAPIFIDDSMAVISASSGLKRSIIFFVSIRDGEIIKNIKMMGEVFSMPVSYKNTYLIGSDDKKLYCIDRKGKTIIWNFKAEGRIILAPVIDEDAEIIYFSSVDGNAYALNLDGKLIWKKHLGTIITNPLIYQNKIILNSNINTVFCLDKNDGSLLWFHELKNRAFDAKIIFDKLLIGCSQGHLLSLNVLDGKILDCFKISNGDIKELSEHEDRLSVKLENGKNYLI